MWRYYLDFVTFPILFIGLVAFDCRSIDWLALAALGALLFTLVEYWTHRSFLHRFFWHGRHERHHKQPSEHVIFPLWHTPAIFAGFFVVLPLPVFAGFVAGYVWFLVLHHALHHWTLRRATWLHGYAHWHNLHHVHDDCNFGITTSGWDWLFGTYRAAA